MAAKFAPLAVMPCAPPLWIGGRFHAFGAWGWVLARAGKIPPHHPAHPRPAAVPVRFAPVPALGPTQRCRAALGARAARIWREDLGGEELVLRRPAACYALAVFQKLIS